jgi:hypothetical protein
LKKRRFLSFLLLTVFLAFLLTQFHSQVKPLRINENFKLVLNDDNANLFPLNDHEKKKVKLTLFEINLFLAPIESVFLYVFPLFSLFLRKSFFVPIFYQSNYVISAP